MHKFKEGQIVRCNDGNLYEVEDTAVDANGKHIYMLRRVFLDYKYFYENEMEAINEQLAIQIKSRP